MDAEEETAQCQTMWQLKEQKNYAEIIAHVSSGCLDCITNTGKKFNGREMLFMDAPPPWIKISETEKANPVAWKKYEKKKVYVQMTPEEFDEFLVNSDFGDEKMVHEIAKFKRVERVAAWEMMRAIRKKRKEIQLENEKIEREKKKKELEAKKEQEKLKKADEKRKIQEVKQLKEDLQQEYLEKMEEEEKLLEESEETVEDEEKEKEIQETSKIPGKINIRREMPWCPSPYDILCVDDRSAIDHSQQKRINAMCLNQMFSGSLQHDSNKRELRDVHKAAESEYDTLVAAALQFARNETCHPLDFLIDKASRLTLENFKRRTPENKFYLRKSPVFTVENIESAGDIRSLAQAIIPKKETLLRKSKFNDVLTIPDMSKKCELAKNQKFTPSHCKLTSDPIATHLIGSNPDVSVMMDATTVCHLLAPNWESRDYEFGIPIEIQEMRVNGVDKKVVILSKPIPCNSITKSSVQRKTLKRILKNQFLKRTPIPLKEVPKSLEATKPAEPEISEDQPSTSDSNNFLDEIISEMSKTTSKKDSNEEILKDFQENGYQYGVFRVGDARILVRSSAPYSFVEAGDKVHQMIGKGQKITFEPRIEYCPNGGAMDLGLNEWIWNYSKAIFKMSDSHVLYRTSYRLDHVLQIDAWTMRTDLAEPPPEALGLLSARTLMLEQMIAQLESTDAGEYMAFQERNQPLVVVPKCTADNRGGVSTDVMKITESDIQKSSESIGDEFFYGFTPNIPFQWQIVQGRAPRMLLAKDSPMIEHMPNKTNRNKLNRRKSNIKRKFHEKEAARSEAKRGRMVDLDDPNLYADFTNPSIGITNFEPSSSERGGFGKRGKFGGHRGKNQRGKFRGRGGGRGGGGSQF